MPWNLGLVRTNDRQLPDPLILWDSRTWDGGSALVNQGTGGSMYDLVVLRDNINIPPYTYARKTKNWGSLGTTAGATFPSTLADIGGPTCDAPFTAIYALPNMDAVTPWYASVYCVINSNTFSPYDLSIFHADIFKYTTPNPDEFVGFADLRINGTDVQEFFGDMSSPTGGNQINPPEVLVTLSVDMSGREMTIWHDTTVFQTIQSSGNINVLEDDYLFDMNPDPICPAADAAIDFNSQFMYFGEHYGAIPTPGTAWNCVVGTAFFRGKPNEADMEYWRDYFFS